MSQEQYLKGIDALRKILEGKSSVERFEQEMEEKMKRASDVGDYEHAKEIRDTLYRLSDLRIRQKMEKANKRPHEEYVGIVRDEKKGMAHVMALKRTHGVINDRRKFEFEIVADNSFSSFLLQYYSSAASIPHVICTSEEPEEKGVLLMSLEKLAGHSVKIMAAGNSGERRQLIDLIMKNLAMYVERGYAPAVAELKKELGLTVMPETIDCFDVSNLGTDIAVGSCVRFVNGRPYKGGYRRFKIESVLGQNDFAMIAELVRRRYKDARDLPDLVVVDGGKGQLGAASSSLASVGLIVSCIGLAKENEEIFVQGAKEPIALPSRSAALNILRHIRDEAHRFALAYNKSLRGLTRP